jgi:hypothetical protein
MVRDCFKIRREIHNISEQNPCASCRTSHPVRMKRFYFFVACVFCAGHSFAADLPLTTPADRQLAEYFHNQTAAISERCLANINSREEWESERAEYRRELQEMLGLWPMPERTDLKPVVTGRITNDDFIVEKIYFQASPDLYCTANLFLPKNLSKPAPTILYECGHWRLLKNGISYGNKAVYQGDGERFARNGYVCLVMDTLLAGEIQGIHTGTRDRGLWWWNSRGYTPAGVEAWFGIRALDYLCTRPEVDTNLFGITGHSGGGAYSWTVTALDDRIKVAAPLAGLADIRSHIGDGVIDNHCDCNFFINIYRWDFPQIAALAAPRPLLIGGTDRDPLFHLDSTLRIYEKLKHVYQLYGTITNLALTIAPGPHDETPELQLAVLRWFNRFLKHEEKPVVIAPNESLTPEQVRVFKTLPTDSINSNVASVFVPEAKPGKKSADELRAQLREKVFAGWPQENGALDPKLAFEIKRDNLRLRAWDFTSQQDVPLRIYLLDDAAVKPADTVSLTVLDPIAATNWLADVRALAGGRAQFSENLAGEFADTNSPAADPVALEKLKREVTENHSALAFFAPRGVGLDAWSGDNKSLTKIRRRFMLLGQTLDGMRVWDIRRAIQTIHYVREDDRAKVELHADGSMAVNALYAALFEPNVKKLELTNLPESQVQGPDYLGVLKICDIPQVRDAVATRAELTLK